MKRGVTYITSDQPGNPVLRRVLVILLVLALLIAAVTAVVILSSRNQVEKTLEQFESACSDQSYDKALSIYRQVQEQALADGLLDQSQDQFALALATMDQIITDRLDQISGDLDNMAMLSGDDLDFIEQMAETTAVHMIVYLRQICRDYLMGQHSLEVLVNAFSQLSDLNNLNTVIGDLPDQFEAMTLAQPLFINASTFFRAGDYWSSWERYNAILLDTEYTGFVHDEAMASQTACQQAMYQPLLDEANDLMAGGRYLSARNALVKMAGVYPEDMSVADSIEICSQNLPKTYVEYFGAIEFLTIKPLIIRQDLAFDGDSYSDAADDTMLTAAEFQNLLAALYAQDYILIDSSRVYTDTRQKAKLQLPEGKKPLVLVIEGLNYYVTRRQTGNCWDLVLDEGGEVAGLYQAADGSMVVDRKAEAIGLLDMFVNDHPDFSHDGAKGTISLTGYECVFGQVTDQDQLDDRNLALTQHGYLALNLTDEDIAGSQSAVSAIMDRLQMTGWQFASSTYGYINAREQPMDRLQQDTSKWLDQVGILTGPVSFLNYPNGFFLTGSDDRAVWLKDQGFILFGGLGASAYLYIGDNYIYVDKTPINGYTLRHPGLYGLTRFTGSSSILER